jgi:hypothetical protein
VLVLVLVLGPLFLISRSKKSYVHASFDELPVIQGNCIGDGLVVWSCVLEVISGIPSHAPVNPVTKGPKKYCHSYTTNSCFAMRLHN